MFTTRHRYAVTAALISLCVVLGVTYQLHSPAGAEMRASSDTTMTDAVAPAVSELVQGLEARLAQNDADFAGWVLLAQSYLHMGAPVAAQPAVARARSLAEGDADRLVQLASAIAGFESETSVSPDELLREALRVAPDHPQARALAAERAPQAASSGAGRLLLDYQPPPLGRNPAGRSPLEPQAATSIDVRVSISDRLLTDVHPDDKVFIFARPATGQQIPLGVVQKQVSELPLTVTLDDATAMMAGHNLSTYAGDLMIVGRVSRSGDATAAAGDLQGMIPHVEPDHAGFLDLVIDQRLD